MYQGTNQQQLQGCQKSKLQLPGLKEIQDSRPQKRQKVEMIGQVIKVEDFFEERISEIETIENAINQSKGNQKLRVFQTVQRYQRRRAASHNPKRMPKHLRMKAIEQLQRDNNPPREMTRRKKRNPKRLAEFNRVGKKWLETHIWHAKRMKMFSRNGIMTPLTPNQKCFRSMYRAAKNEATFVDSSWKKIIQLQGEQAELQVLLESIADPSLSSFTAELYLLGNRSGKQFIHERNQWPLGAVCPVDFIWNHDVNGSARLIWIWVDSYCYDMVCSLFSDILTANINMQKIESMNRFEVDGPRAHAILSHTLLLSKDNTLWSCFKDVNTPGILQEGVAITLDIHDPRVIFPRLMPAKVGIEHKLNALALDALANWPEDSAKNSKIWDLYYHKDILKTRASNSQLAARRSNNVIPGSPLDIVDSDPSVPLMLIRRRNQGWDLIFPMGWGPSILNLLFFAGIRVGGSKEMDNYQFECGQPSFPVDHPESLIQDQLAKIKEETEMKKYFTRPKAKRPGFKGIQNPFRTRFCDILGQESGPVGVFHSVHIAFILENIMKTMPKDYDTFKIRLLEDIKNLIKNRPNFELLKNLNTQVLDSMFVRVYLTCESGNLKEGSIIHSGLGSLNQLDLSIPKELCIGYTTRANFSLLNRKCAAIGCCLLKGVYEAFKTRSVYIRSRTDRKSRLARFKLIH